MIRKVLILLVMICVACFQLAEGSDQEVVQKLDQMFLQYFNENEPGGAVIIVKNGKVLFEKGYGIADIKTKKKITPDTVFNVGSISKTFVANGILILQQDGKLNLKDPVNKYFKDFKNKEISAKVLLIHLLTHTSGIIDSRKKAERFEFYLTAGDRGNFEPILNNESTHFNPGEDHGYSNPAYNGLALIIEKLSGGGWRKFIKEKIFIPAGMKQSTITKGSHPSKGVAHAYVKSGKEFLECDYGEVVTFCAAGNGGVWSTVRDLMNYEIALQKGIFLNKKMLKESRKVYHPKNWKGKEDPMIGYSWFIYKGEKPEFVGHTGSQGGFKSDYLYLPKEKIHYVLLCNIPKPIKEIRKEVFKILSLD